MLGQKEKSKALKRAILEDIREDNLCLADPQRTPLNTNARSARIKPNTPSRFIGLALALVAGLSIFFLFSRYELPLMASRLHSDIDTSQQPVQNTKLSLSNSLSTDGVPMKTPATENSQVTIKNLTMGPVPPNDNSQATTNDLITDPVPAYSVDTRDYDILVNNNDVRLTTLFGLGVRTIVIDPGHGGKDPGAIGAQGTMEKEVTLDVARRLKNRLEEKTAFNIYMTRETDETMSLSDRVKFTNAVGADLFVSIHVNSIPEASINTIETYYFGPPSDEKTLRLAERENADSMYSSADFNKLIQKIGNTIKQQESIALATKIQRSLFANIQKYDKDVHNWGVKVAPFMVLLDVEAPAVLSEISCISEPEEEQKLNTTDYREKIASFIENGIIAYLTPKQVQAQRGDKDEFKKDG